MPVFHLFPSDVMGDGISVVFESQEGIGQMSNWVADGLEGVCKFGLESGSGDWAVHVMERRDPEMVSVGSSWVLNLVTSLCVISSLLPSLYAME